MVPRQPIRLQAQGKTVMLLSADKPQVAADIAAAVSIDDYRAATMLPEHKPSAVTELRTRHGSIALVGDGISDAPAAGGAR
ncbi:hypothetical protein AB0C28_41545 [Nonomuraea sp. NPDC048892]|uniref:hypothetical protein n=1 Tax=Nonomuraea sp. NPDC048892 TaxID=3154624 RepID=UPI000A516DED